MFLIVEIAGVLLRISTAASCATSAGMAVDSGSLAGCRDGSFRDITDQFQDGLLRRDSRAPLKSCLQRVEFLA